MIDLSNIVGLSSGDISAALGSFFAIGPVLGVVAAIITLALAPVIFRAVRQMTLARAPGVGFEPPLSQDEFFEQLTGTGAYAEIAGGTPGLMGVGEFDSPFPADPATAIAAWESTPEEIEEARLADYNAFRERMAENDAAHGSGEG